MRRKKSPKSKVSTKSKPVNEDSWRTEIETLTINDDQWWCIIAMMVETRTNHSQFVSVFNDSVEEGKRKAIHSLSNQKMLANIRTLSKQSIDKVPAVQGVCHYASKVLAEEKNSMPTWLVARVIKYLIYRAREDNIGIVKRLADLEREIDEEYRIMQTVADWGQPGSKGFNAEKFNNKANTRLRKRNEEWRDAIFINDAPLDGPNLYIILTGFHDPDLPETLMEAGVPLTTVVPIKRPREQFYRLTEREISEESEQAQEVLLGQYTCSRLELFKFWTTIYERWTDYEAHPLLCDIAFPAFCPPNMEPTYDEDEYERQKQVAYDEVSYFLYDLYDLHRQHRNYLKSMKVEDVADVKDTCDKTVYESLLDSLPADRVSVAFILFAMLMQVTGNEETGEEEGSKGWEDDENELQMWASSNMEKEGETADPSTIAAVNEKLSSLNTKFSLIEENHADSGQQNATDIELILHGDSLTKTIRLNKSAKFSMPSGSLIDILPLFWHPGIMDLHSKHEIPKERLEKYSHHISGSRRYFDVEINNEEVSHYLHILMFDRLFFSTPKVVKKKGTESWARNSSSFSLKHSKSVPSLRSRSIPEIHFHSDGKIDYTKTALKLIECSPLFDLIDPREFLVPGYLLENVFNRKCTDLQEFDDAELLARAIFLQRVHQCLLSFDRFEAFYFEPTDSVLLRFANDWRVNDVRRVETVSNIRTPVCFRDFCQYVVEEEEDWIRFEEEENRLRTSESMGRLMMKVQEMYEETMLFRDEDFILPGSLKAKDLERIADSAKGKKSQAGTLSATTSEEPTKGKKKKKGKGKEKAKEKRKKGATNEKKLNVEKASPSTLEESSRVDDSENVGTYFIGYDLGRLRVQVTNRVKTFLSADGTVVRVAIDDWLYGNKDLRVTVTIRGNSLRLFRRIGGSREADQVFHMTNKVGVIVSFEKQFQLQSHAWSRSVDFRASWPSGLTIEPISCEEPGNPFYIHQSYITKNSDANQEVCRKFLRNGTVLRYLTNGDIVVLRPNGAIVTCTAFENLHLSEDEVPVGEADIAKRANGNTPSKEPKAFIANKGRPDGLKSQLSEVGEVDPTLARQDSTTFNVMDSTVKVSRYTVLDHDGQWYEVADDLVVSVHHRLLVRTASDYEVDEKFTRRADGTDMLLKSNGELIVGFPDGTRITTGYTIEEEPVICDWTEEEIQRYFASEWTKGEEGYVSVPRLKQTDGDSPRSSAEYESDTTDIDEILIADGFVSVLLTCRAEHKKYATVFYGQSAVSCALSMPDDLRVSISRSGHYEVSMADGVNLKIEDDSLSLRGNTCASCGSQSTSSYQFIPSDSPGIIFTNVDVFGNTFEVLDNGCTHYHRNIPPEPCELNGDVGFAEGFHEEGGSEEEEDRSREDLKRRCHHESIHRLSSGTQYRIFSVNRDLTAYEYLHRSVVNQAELAAVFDKEASVILYRNPHRPELRRLITFETVKPESPSKDLLSLQVYKVKPTNFDRRDLIRSTYSIPYDWLFPFGKNGDGIWKNAHDLLLTSCTDLVLPELLRIRILCNFKKPDGNAVIDIQRALGRYWMSLVSGIEELSIAADEQEEERQGKGESISRHLEDSLRDLALGIRNTIDTATYKLGLQRRQAPKVKAAPTSAKLEELLRQRAADQETIEWYKRSMRERIIIPYFQNTVGTCFLVVENCVEMAVKSSRANELPDECNESDELCGTCHQTGRID